MLAPTLELLCEARQDRYAIGAFNVYNLEGVLAVVNAAEAAHSPAMLQIHPAAWQYGNRTLVALCLEAARGARVPMSVHFDHAKSAAAIREAVEAGILSIMADGSECAYPENVEFTRAAAGCVHPRSGLLEAELGRLAGTEDGLTVSEYESKLTDAGQAAAFVAETGIDALAVCVGNVHGAYRGEPRLDLVRLAAIREAVSVPLVLHGASGLPPEAVRRCVELGVTKFNVNTEVRQAYVQSLKARLSSPQAPDLVDLLRGAVDGMEAVVGDKLELFGSIGKAYH